MDAPVGIAGASPIHLRDNDHEGTVTDMAGTRSTPASDGGQTIAVRPHTSTDLQALSTLESILLTNTSDGGPEIVDDPEEMSREIIAQILGAESDAELESFGTAVGWRNLQGVPVRLSGFSWRASDYDEGSVIYFVVRGDVVKGDGELEPIVLTTGSRFVLAQLTNMAKRGTLVGAVRELVQSERATKGGFHPLRLRTPAGA